MLSTVQFSFWNGMNVHGYEKSSAPGAALDRPLGFSTMYLRFLTTSSTQQAMTVTERAARITAMTAMVLADLSPFPWKNPAEQVDPSTDSHRLGFSRYALGLRVLKNGVTGIGPVKLL